MGVVVSLVWRGRAGFTVKLLHEEEHEGEAGHFFRLKYCTGKGVCT